MLFGLPEARGFALAGGSALLALGAIDRPTRDIDAFVAAKPETPPGDVGPLVAALGRRLVAEGWTVSVDRELVTFARLVARRADDAVEVDLAVDSPPLLPIEVVEGLPVLSGQDLAARKVLAILDRAEDATSPISGHSPIGTRKSSASVGHKSSTPASESSTSAARSPSWNASETSTFPVHRRRCPNFGHGSSDGRPSCSLGISSNRCTRGAGWCGVSGWRGR